MLLALGCGARAAPRQVPACHQAPLPACAEGGGTGDIVRGHVAIGSMVCLDQQAGAGCHAAYVVTDDAEHGTVTIRGPELGCTGPRDALCCPLDALHREVVAHGALHHDQTHTWMDVTEICGS